MPPDRASATVPPVPEASTVTVAHVSDLHPTGIARPTPWTLLGKRALGYAHLVLRRNRRHPFALLQRTAEDLRDDPPDHLLVGGDVVNLGLPEEFAAVRRLLGDTGLPAEAISAVPGNHDRYTSDSLRRPSRVLCKKSVRSVVGLSARPLLLREEWSEIESHRKCYEGDTCLPFP